MKTELPEPTTRSEAWKNAAWYALILAAILLVVLKMFTPLVFGPALAIAIVIFLFGFGFFMRITPRRGG